MEKFTLIAFSIVFKIFSKVLANRLRKMKDLVDTYQTAFIKGIHFWLCDCSTRGYIRVPC